MSKPEEVGCESRQRRNGATTSFKKVHSELEE